MRDILEIPATRFELNVKHHLMVKRSRAALCAILWDFSGCGTICSLIPVWQRDGRMAGVCVKSYQTSF